MSDDELEEIVIDLGEMEDEADDDGDWDDGFTGWGWDDKLGWHDLGLTRSERDALREEAREEDRREQAEHDAITPTEWMGQWMRGWDRELRLIGRKLTVPMIVKVWMLGMQKYSRFYDLNLDPRPTKQWSGGSKFPKVLPLVFTINCMFGHRVPDDSDYAPVQLIVRDSGYVKVRHVEKVTCECCGDAVMDEALTLCQRCEDGIESELHKAGHPRFEQGEFARRGPDGEWEIYGDTSPFAFVLAEIKRMHELAWAVRVASAPDLDESMLRIARSVISKYAMEKPRARAIEAGASTKIKVEWTDESAIAWLLANGITPEMSGKAAWAISNPIPGRPVRKIVYALQPRPTAP